MSIQVQPEYKDAKDWEELAESEGLDFEILELSMPNVMAMQDKDAVISWYRSRPETAALHGNFMDNNPASSDPDMTALSIRKLEESCNLAQTLGVKNVVFHSGAFPYLRGRYLDKWSYDCAKVYDRLAREYDLNLLIENSQDVDPQPLVELMAKVEDPRIGVCLDIGHANYSREALENWFNKLAYHIRYIHLSDNMGMFDDHIPLGTGTVDWKKADHLVKELKKDIPITLETGNLNKTKASIRFLQEHGYFGY